MGLDNRREELRVLGKQLIRSGTSVAANYREASRARSNEEFTAKIVYAVRKQMKHNSGWNCSAMNAVSYHPLSNLFGRNQMNLSVSL